ncbi:hypothetical protein N836_03930 [Leptolyngbya sp. Heron Island J]|nr:hypothetical protein N836_03930 [Leptolyngbya sp. Heron Island J]
MQNICRIRKSQEKLMIGAESYLEKVTIGMKALLVPPIPKEIYFLQVHARYFAIALPAASML